MINVAGRARNRAACLLAAAALLVALVVMTGQARAEASPAAPQGATASIVHGKSTSIKRWPWQVAVAVGKKARPGFTPRERTFCGGSLIAPDLVITAGHCMADVSPRNVKRTDVITGRTHLNYTRAGEEVGVKRLYMPEYSNGKRKFRSGAGAADWDVSLLLLDHPVAGTPIQIAGEDEQTSWQTGSQVKTTGWGITNPNENEVTNGLRLASLVMQPERICRGWDGVAFKAARMVCFGAPSIHASACNGDSGGPLMSTVTTPLGKQYRLVGLTSWGDFYCRGAVPSVDTRIADNPLRGWVKRTAMEVSGVDVVGHGGASAAPVDWCRVPDIQGYTLKRAKAKLESKNCRLGQTTPDNLPGARSGTVTYTEYFPHWLAKPGARVKVGVVP